MTFYHISNQSGTVISHLISSLLMLFRPTILLLLCETHLVKTVQSLKTF